MNETQVSYTIKYQGKFYIIENVPARICQETGEEYFSPETVEHIQKFIKGHKTPDRTITNDPGHPSIEISNYGCPNFKLWLSAN
ncbi:YgiT-type zinc finger protein [sulfur-oxidizing endosymbiont of Gigantopelta aegis]|uniref:YgiT-type zinc finger protein n=1 Tax=sulfur-oxidizing endosymbiont of Gigantopelta aegis TaxID=2794934 RepID=UPI0031B63C3D